MEELIQIALPLGLGIMAGVVKCVSGFLKNKAHDKKEEFDKDLLIAAGLRGAVIGTGIYYGYTEEAVSILLITIGADEILKNIGKAIVDKLKLAKKGKLGEYIAVLNS